MKRLERTAAHGMLAVRIAAACVLAVVQSARSEVLFDGTSFEQWQGDPRFWSVQDGAITGTVVPGQIPDEGAFLVWKGAPAGDFELRLKVRIRQGGGSPASRAGIQYRSRWMDFDTPTIAGYRAEIAGSTSVMGRLFDGSSRGLLAAPGQEVSLRRAPDGRLDTRIKGPVGSQERRAALAARMREGEWLEYTIVARDQRLQHLIGGVPIVDAVDQHFSSAANEGLIALHLQGAQPLQVQFKDIRLERLSPQESAGEPVTAATSATPAAAIHVPAGFRVDLLYSVPNHEQGSWVAMTVDDRGRLIASDQYGALYRIALPPPAAFAQPSVEKLTTRLSGAQGLLYAFGSLYVMVNETYSLMPGIWRLRDTDGDDRFDETRLVLPLQGRDEHGPHALVLSPDGKSIYFAGGNDTLPPPALLRRPAFSWGEDDLLPRLYDPEAYTGDAWVPYGFTGRVSPGGEAPQLIAMGFRNHYDIAFDANGELFTYDSDMEWDAGAPWYLPTRLLHVVKDGDYGFRNGSGRYPSYYEDSLPAVQEVGPGSPTGLIFGTGARFPERYQRALFAADWTFGTLYAFHLKPQGASFSAHKEEFLSAKPLPLTDLLVHPDGALYFIVGGRRIQSALYRVTYVGKESTAKAAPLPPTSAARQLHAVQSATSLDAIWPSLGDTDRFIRYTARIRLEKLSVPSWLERALAERDARAGIEALIALARVGDRSLQPRLIDALSRHDLSRMSADLKLALLRAWQLTFVRMGKPDPARCASVAARFEKVFPDPDYRVSRELATLLVHLDSREVVAKAVPLLKVSETHRNEIETLASSELLSRNEQCGGDLRVAPGRRADQQQLAYATALRNARFGWTPGLRRAYMEWFPATAAWQGGNSMQPVLKAIREQALSHITMDPEERATLERVATAAMATPTRLEVTAPQGPGHPYTLTEAITTVDGHLQSRNFERGRSMFDAIACNSCHRFGGEGGSVGPDLTAVGNRFGVRDILESIVDPGKVVSSQYGNVMPPGLINALNEDELRDLIAYLISGGDPDDRMFAPRGKSP